MFQTQGLKIVSLTTSPGESAGHSLSWAPSVPLLLLSEHANQAIVQNLSVQSFSPRGWGHTFACVASF